MPITSSTTNTTSTTSTSNTYLIVLPCTSGVETASHAGHCPVNLVNVR